MSNFIDLTGQKFGRLTVIKRVENTKEGRAKWLCQCECGHIIKVNGRVEKRYDKFQIIVNAIEKLN